MSNLDASSSTDTAVNEEMLETAVMKQNLDGLPNSPAAIIEQMCKFNNLELEYIFIDFREETSSEPAHYLIETHVRGFFPMLGPEKQTKRFLGIAKTSRDAKDNSIALALTFLKTLSPGVQHLPGAIPPQWMDWILSNLQLGCSTSDIIAIILRKGFILHSNTGAMQLLCTWNAFIKFKHKISQKDLSLITVDSCMARVSDCPTAALHLPQIIIDWIDSQLSLGTDGKILVTVLESNCIHLLSFPEIRNRIVKNIISTDTTMDHASSSSFILRDFWRCCALGMVDDAVCYVSAGQDANERQLSQSHGVSMTGVLLAAENGHCDLIEALVNAGANINCATENGLSCLHLAARNGFPDVCSLLFRIGISPYIRDAHGNTALHYGSRNGECDSIRALIEGSMTLVRNVVSGKVACVVEDDGRNLFFNDLVLIVFDELQTTKLSNAMMRRFEKSWVMDAAHLLVSKMDSNVAVCVEVPSSDVITNVMKRFDPDPDASAALTASDEQESVQDDIMVIQEAEHLRIILSWCFRLASVNPQNKIKRSPLHDCCFANYIDSHLPPIQILVEEYGCDTLTLDISGKRPIDILAQHKNRPGSPSGTDLREEVLFEKRADRLNDMKKEKNRMEQIEREKRQVIALDDAFNRAYHQSTSLWDATIDASSTGWEDENSKWMRCEDPETGIDFFHGPTIIEDSEAEEKSADNTPFERKTHQWFRPPARLRYASMMNTAWNVLKYRSKFVRKISSWEVFQDTESDKFIYYNSISEEYTLDCPRECQSHAVIRTASVVQRLGYDDEWDELKDKNGNQCFASKMNNIFSWEKPLAAVDKKSLSKKCTREKDLKELIYQGWYTCDQCNEAGQDEECSLVKLCVACAKRCHGSHLGVRFIRSSGVVCTCDASCQSLTENESDLHLRMKILQEEVVRAQRKALSLLEEVQLVPTPLDNNDIVNWPGGWHICSSSKHQSYSEWKTYNHFHSVGRLAEGSIALVSHPLCIKEVKFLCIIDKDRENVGKANVSFISVSDMNEMVDFDIRRMLHRLQSLRDVNWNQENTIRKKIDMKPMEKRAIGILSDLSQFEACVVDRSTVMLLSYGQYGFSSEFGKNTFKYNADLDLFNPMIKASIDIEDNSNGLFSDIICNGKLIEVELISTAWMNVKSEFDHMKFPTLSGSEWNDVDKRSTIVRSFNDWNEKKSSAFDASFYKNESRAFKEKCVIVLQTLFRKKFYIPCYKGLWYSTAFQFNASDSVMLQKMEKIGWGLMKRRSKKIRSILDTNRETWFEYVDSVTTETFYYNIQDDRYDWERPTSLSNKKSSATSFNAEYKVDDIVMAIFPGELAERQSKITKVREEIDDDSGDMIGILYDIESIGKERKMRFAESKVIRGLRLSGEELNLRKQEILWKNNLKRTRESQKRKLERDRKKAISNQKFALRGESRLFVADSTDESSTSEGIKKRNRRCELEAEEIEAERQEIINQKAKQNILHVHEMDSKKNEPMETIEEIAVTKSPDDVIGNLRKFEIGNTSPRTDRRRHVLRYLHVSMQRQDEKFVVCEWGCKTWVKLGQNQFNHEMNDCPKRVLQCIQSCSLRMKFEDWKSPSMTEGLTIEQNHCKFECPKRLVPCPQMCGTWITWEDIGFHTKETCVRRPAVPIKCRNNCGESFGGTMEELIRAEEDRMEHENESCTLRNVKCTWTNCGVTIRACDRESHRDYHIQASGISKYQVPGSFIFVNSMHEKQIKIQAWGAGGGSGYFKGRKAGNGGGGALVEIILSVGPGDILDIVVGQGGFPGTEGSLSILYHDNSTPTIKESMMTSLGGTPGGGNGHSICEMFACGGGGGYTSVSKRSVSGPVILLLSGGGGGGGSLDGLPATDIHGSLAGSLIDRRNGQSASAAEGGVAGYSPNTLVTKFPAQNGEKMKGGNGAETAAGGGSGYYGGGGGGTCPGAAGGGGGGSSWVNEAVVVDSVVLASKGRNCGGETRNPPAAIGIAEWDVITGLAGDGGVGSMTGTDNGRHGCVVIYKTGFY